MPGALAVTSGTEIHLRQATPTGDYDELLVHELTHVVWSWLFGGKLKKFKATSEGGEVVITKSNFLVALAPYFFPLYAVFVVVVFLVGHLIWNWSAWTPLFHGILGAAYAFHLTLTIEVLKTEQSDITSQGYLFSGVIIFLGNALGLLLAIPLLTGQGRLIRSKAKRCRQLGASRRLGRPAGGRTRHSAE